jgi:hypothetical protein
MSSLVSLPLPSPPSSSLYFPSLTCSYDDSQLSSPSVSLLSLPSSASASEQSFVNQIEKNKANINEETAVNNAPLADFALKRSAPDDSSEVKEEIQENKRIRVASPSESTSSPLSSALSSPSISPVPSVGSAPSSLVLDKPRSSSLIKARVINSYPNKPLHSFSFQIPLSLRTGEQDPNAERFVPFGHNELFLSLPLRVMGSVASSKELYVVATDLCQLINIRKSNTAKTVCQFNENEKVSMPIVCHSSNGNTSIRLFTCLTMAGICRLLQSSRSAFAVPLWGWISKNFKSFTAPEVDKFHRQALLTSITHLRLLYRKSELMNSLSPLLNIGAADLSIIDVSNERKELSHLKKQQNPSAPVLMSFPQPLSLPIIAQTASNPIPSFSYNPYLLMPGMSSFGFPYSPVMPLSYNPLGYSMNSQLHRTPGLMFQASYRPVPPIANAVPR